MKRLLFLSAALLAASPAAAQQEPADTSQVHVVRPGDTLWDLARRYLRDPFLWPEIFRANRERVADPDRIFPAERLRIPSAPVAAAASPPSGAPVAADTTPARTVFFRVEEEVATPLESIAAERAPVVTPGDFYRAGLLVPDEALPTLGTLVEVLSPTVLPIDHDPQVALHDRVFVRLSPRGRGAVRVGGHLHLWRPGREVEPFGRVYESTGLATVRELNGEIATLEVVQLFDRVAVGDLVVPVRDFELREGVLPRPATGLQGRLLAFEEPHALHGLQDLAFVDLGEQSGVREGDEFVAVLPPDREPWGVRPEIPVARLQVVRTSGRTSAVRVVHLDQPALQPGLPVRLVKKMP